MQKTRYRVYSRISIAWNKHNRAAFSNSEHSDLVFLPKKITKKLFISNSPNSTPRDLFKTGVKVPVGAREPSEVETPEIPRRRATSKIADVPPWHIHHVTSICIHN